MDIKLDLWPSTIQLGATTARFAPPFLNDFCWWSEWSASLLELWVDVSISLWECDAGLFDYILNNNSHDCGLATYEFKNPAFELKWGALDQQGDIFPETCYLKGKKVVPVPEVQPPAPADSTSIEEP